MKNSHGGYGGKTLIQRIEKQMDKQREKEIFAGVSEPDISDLRKGVLLGRIDGMAGALAILRSSSIKEEMQRSNDRLGL